MCYWCWQMENMNTLDNDLEMMYPKIYHDAYPMVVMHCDRLENKYGPMFTLRNEELEDICEDMYKKLKDHLDDDDDDDRKIYEDNSYARMPRFDRRRGVNDILRILLLRELIGRRRMRRRPYGFGGY